jgi:poly-gamma-glutamate synthesis protein (capsule biosynthesis protein)
MRWCGILLVLTCLGVRAEPVRLIFTGDVMLDEGPGQSIAAGRDPLAHFAGVLADADYRIGNLECPVATTGQPMASKIFNFRAAPRVLPLLKNRFDAMAVANNHAGDYGKAAFLETLDLLGQSGIRTFGGGRNLAEAHQPLWIEKAGLRIAVLGYNEFKPRVFEATADAPGIAWSEDSHVISDIRAARTAGADIVIPFMHWGWERETQPTARQRQLARTLIDAGADLVVGGHPHVTQGVEYYKGRLIVYSLGNFVFDGFTLPAARVGWVLRLSVDRDGLVAWDTLAAHMDESGTPHPGSGDLTPCGRRGHAAVDLCRNP